MPTREPPRSVLGGVMRRRTIRQAVEGRRALRLLEGDPAAANVTSLKPYRIDEPWAPDGGGIDLADGRQCASVVRAGRMAG